MSSFVCSSFSSHQSIASLVLLLLLVPTLISFGGASQRLLGILDLQERRSHLGLHLTKERVEMVGETAIVVAIEILDAIGSELRGILVVPPLLLGCLLQQELLVRFRLFTALSAQTLVFFGPFLVKLPALLLEDLVLQRGSLRLEGAMVEMVMS